MLSIISGKPGSGKTYHMATILVDMLTDWVRYELKNEKPFDSTIWTNIVFQNEGLNETISKRLGREIDVSQYMQFCDNTFFNDPDCTYWWKKFPAKSVIIIDEVHFYLGQKVQYGSLDLETELINWISTHRHSQQEIYFLSQHTDQFANQVLGIADKLLEVVNLKSLDLKWPISVSMSDIDELKRSFGITTQYYQANKGNFRGKAVKWSGSSERHMMTADIFRVYKSHDAGVEESDRPSLKMTPFEGMLWFAKRHAWHLVPKAAFAISLPFIFMWVVFGIPEILMAAASGGSAAEKKIDVVNKETISKKENERAPASTGKTKTNTAVAKSVDTKSENTKLVNTKSANAESVNVRPSVPKAVQNVLKDKKITMLYQEGVMCDDGSKVSVGETLVYEGKTETLACVSVVCGIIGFESGKKVRF